MARWVAGATIVVVARDASPAVRARRRWSPSALVPAPVVPVVPVPALAPPALSGGAHGRGGGQAGQRPMISTRALSAGQAWRGPRPQGGREARVGDPLRPVAGGADQVQHPLRPARRPARRAPHHVADVGPQGVEAVQPARRHQQLQGAEDSRPTHRRGPRPTAAQRARGEGAAPGGDGRSTAARGGVTW